MLRVLIIDDDAEVRTKALRCLARADVELSSAANGLLGLAKARQLKPDLVVCDIDMPGMNGFEVLEALRADAELASTQVMLLTGQSSRHSMRLGMTLGADDYLTKPFTDDELVSAFNGLLKKRGRMELLLDQVGKNREEVLRRMFAHTFSAGTTAQRPAIDEPWSTTIAGAQTLGKGAVLHSHIRGFTALAEKLAFDEVEKLLCAYFERACAPVRIHGGRYLHMMGDSLAAVFVEDPAMTAPPACRALRAALAMNAMAAHFGEWITDNFPDRGLPVFSVGCGIAYGPVSVSRVEGDAPGGGIAAGIPAGIAAGIPAGKTARLAAWLEAAGQARGWNVCATTLALAQAGSEVESGKAEALAWTEDASPVGVAEVRRVATRDTVAIHGRAGVGGHVRDPRDDLQTLPQSGLQTLARLQVEVKENAQAAARAVKNALGETLVSIKNHSFDAGSAPPQLAGFQLVRRLGSGGMSSIYLGKRQPGGDLFVLKVIESGPRGSQQMARFIREYSLVQAIRHPNIIRIYNQGFGQAHAYIAMEYFENGDLRQRMDKPFTHAAALAATVQIASALSVIHKLGVVHRDLKPENLMVRADGAIVLADFGIAKAIVTSEHHELSVTQAGEMVGTPSYMSPEQVAAIEAVPQSDLYSLGVILFELLTGELPYRARDMLSMLSLHFNAPTPRLPASCAAFQPLLDRLMDKHLSQRYASADELLADLAVFSP